MTGSHHGRQHGPVGPAQSGRHHSAVQHSCVLEGPISAGVPFGQPAGTESAEPGAACSAWPPLSGLMLAATKVLFPYRSLADHSWLAQTETWAIVAEENRACCPGLRTSTAAMKMLWR
jgi:hypothetical protein